MVPLGTTAIDFSLPDPSGIPVSLSDFSGSPATLIVFMCNHCPYVIHLRHALAAFGKEAQARNATVIGINSNDFVKYPSDNPAAMAQEIEETGYTFPYLVDESQEVARAYQATCTPDFFLYDGAMRLAYRGQFDASRPGNGLEVTGADLKAALDAVLSGQAPKADQIPSIGCNIKWKAI